MSRSPVASDLVLEHNHLETLSKQAIIHAKSIIDVLVEVDDQLTPEQMAKILYLTKHSLLILLPCLEQLEDSRKRVLAAANAQTRKANNYIAELEQRIGEVIVH